MTKWMTLTGQRAKQATTVDDLNNVAMSNLVSGNVLNFQVEVKGVVDPNHGIDECNSGFPGFEYGVFVVGELDPLFGGVKKIKVSATVGYDGNIARKEDQITISRQMLSLEVCFDIGSKLLISYFCNKITCYF